MTDAEGAPVAASSPEAEPPADASANADVSPEVEKAANKAKPKPKERPAGKSKEEASGVVDIWAQLLEQNKNQDPADPVSSREATICFIGPRHSGKSTMIHTYMFKDKEDTPKPTTSLDYKYTRSSVGMSMEKDLSHFWELGGGRALSNLLEICITPETLEHTLVVINLDLSRPTAIVDDCLYWLNTLRERVRECITKLRAEKSSIPQALEQAARERYGDHEDLSRINMIEIPVLVVANKYDLIKDEKADTLKVISRALRVIAHSNGCGLLYTSKKLKEPLQTFRSRISRHVLNRPPSKNVKTDYTKPLNVPAGCDKFEDIGMPSDAGAQTPEVAWCEYFKQVLPPNDEEREMEVVADVGKLAAEPAIDQMLAQKNEDLKQLKRKVKLKRLMKQQDVLDQQRK